MPGLCICSAQRRRLRYAQQLPRLQAACAISDGGADATEELSFLAPGHSPGALRIPVVGVLYVSPAGAVPRAPGLRVSKAFGIVSTYGSTHARNTSSPRQSALSSRTHWPTPLKLRMWSKAHAPSRLPKLREVPRQAGGRCSCTHRA